MDEFDTLSRLMDEAARLNVPPEEAASCATHAKTAYKLATEITDYLASHYDEAHPLDVALGLMTITIKLFDVLGVPRDFQLQMVRTFPTHKK